MSLTRFFSRLFGPSPQSLADKAMEELLKNSHETFDMIQLAYSDEQEMRIRGEALSRSVGALANELETMHHAMSEEGKKKIEIKLKTVINNLRKASKQVYLQWRRSMGDAPEEIARLKTEMNI